MAKDSKADEATVEVKVSELQAAKDQIITVLMNVQNYIGQLNNAYMAHINSVIAGGPATIDFPTLPPSLSHPLNSVDMAILGGRAGSPGANTEAGNKKRKRAPVDPNAPKRALTPYFLYMQHNRAAIAGDMPEGSKPKEISEEGTRRWQAMGDAEREIWKSMYNKNYEQYKKKMADYKAGRKVEDDDGAANQLQQDIASADNDKDSSDSDSDSDSKSDSEDESSPSPPQPTPKEKTPAKGRKAAKEVPESVSKSAPASQKKGKGKKAAEPAATPAEPKSKGGRKKRKSEA